MGNSKLRPEYRQELADLENKMLDAQMFAEKFPVFADKILSGKFTKEFTGEISSNYKGMYFGWGIKRWLYTDKKNITNYRGDFSPQYLWNIYINQSSLFNDYYWTGLDEVYKTIELFFYDHLNSTFYATDEQLIPTLDAIVEWYEKAKIINDEKRKETKMQDLLKQLEALK